MARGRMLSKTLSTSRKFAAVALAAGELGEFCQTLYALLVAHADDFGRLSGDAFTVKHRCHPTSIRGLPEFEAALQQLHDAGLLTRYVVGADVFVEITDFEQHQAGLHKRTASKFPNIPGTSGKLPDIPKNSLLREGKGRELNRREGKGTDARKDARTSPPAAPPRKRPLFEGERLTVFDWQWADCDRTLGTHAEAFDLHAWFFALDAMAVQTGLVIPKRDHGVWLQAQLVAECQRRGLPLRMANGQGDARPTNAELTQQVAKRLGFQV